VYARGDADDFDGDFKTKTISQRFGDGDYDWERSKGSGSKVIGEGEFGSVIKEGGGNRVVKRGEIGVEEVQNAKRLADKDLGPRPLAAEIDGKGSEPRFKVGRMAMELIPGEPIGRDREPDDKIGGQKVADAFWRARAGVHRLGIAHNDMHIDNLLIDSKGEGRFVDLGISQGFPKAALAEALGLFAGPMAKFSGGKFKLPDAQGDGDWQVLRWKGTGGKLFERAWGVAGTPAAKNELAKRAPVLSKIADNYLNLVKQMQRDGLTLSDISTLVVHGIRSPKSSYKRGIWEKLSDGQVLNYIDMLYEGV
jgi:hypothetical protein